MREINIKNKINMSGYMLIEVVISIFIVGLVLVVFLNVLAASYRTEFAKRDNIVAANLAQEGIEIIRSMRDANLKKAPIPLPAFTPPGALGGFFPINSDHCVDYLGVKASSCSNKLRKNNTTGFYQYAAAGSTATIFSRSIVITSPNNLITDDSRTIEVTVSWNKWGIVQSVKMTDTLYAWGDAN